VDRFLSREVLMIRCTKNLPTIHTCTHNTLPLSYAASNNLKPDRIEHYLHWKVCNIELERVFHSIMQGLFTEILCHDAPMFDSSGIKSHACMHFPILLPLRFKFTIEITTLGTVAPTSTSSHRCQMIDPCVPLGLAVDPDRFLDLSD